MAEGRPKAAIDTLPAGWQQSLLSLYGAGGSDVEARALLANLRGTMSKTLWDRWMQEEPEFSGTIKAGRLLANAWWERIVREGKIGHGSGQVHPTAWVFTMKNRFGWHDKQHIEHAGGIRSYEDRAKAELDARIQEMLHGREPEAAKPN